MPDSQTPHISITKQIILAAACAFSLACAAGCVMDAPSEAAAPAASNPDVGAKLTPEAPAVPSDIPVGCSREWSDTAMDSVLYCPDIRPPKPR